MFGLRNRSNAIRDGLLRSQLSSSKGNVLILGSTPWESLSATQRKKFIFVDIKRDVSFAEMIYIQADASALPFPDAMFDLVIVEFLLCSVSSQENVLLEVSRILKPKPAKLLLIEHVRSSSQIGLLLQRMATSIQSLCSCSCNLLSEFRDNIPCSISIDKELFFNHIFEPIVFIEASKK